MKVGKMLAPVHSLGPGSRVVLWTQGCKKQCPGCISPEFQCFSEEKEIPVKLLASILKETAARNGTGKLTISGGDPFEQPEELFSLLREIQDDFDDILVYTGYLYEEIKDGSLSLEAEAALAFVDVLIDGPYVESLNVPEAVLRGSENQRILYLNQSKKEEYESYLKEGRRVETFVHDGTVSFVGILDRSE